MSRDSHAPKAEEPHWAPTASEAPASETEMRPSSRDGYAQRQTDKPSESMSSFSFADSAYGTATSTSYDTELSAYSREPTLNLDSSKELPSTEEPSRVHTQDLQRDESPTDRDYLMV